MYIPPRTAPLSRPQRHFSAHRDQQYIHLSLLEKKAQCNPVLENDFIDTRTIPAILTSEVPEILLSSQSEGMNIQVSQRFKKVQKAANIVFDRMKDETLHPQLKGKHVEDLFQICHYMMSLNDKLLKENATFKEENNLQKQRIQYFEELQKNDHELVVENPSQDDLKKLKASVADLQSKIDAYGQSHLKDVLLHPEATQSHDFNDVSKNIEIRNPYVMLQQTKLKLLEDFIVQLQKKIQFLEQADEDVKTLADEFGSVSNLLSENLNLQKQNKIFEWMKKRYDINYLLNHEHIYSNDVTFLKTIVFGLQNELSMNLESMKYFTFTENGALKLAVKQNQGPLDPTYQNIEAYASIRKAMEDVFPQEECKEIIPDQNDPELYHPVVFNLQSKISIINQENSLLKQQVERFRSELSHTDKLLKLLKSQYESSLDGRFELKQIDIIARTFKQQIRDLNEQTRKRENQFVAQQTIFEEKQKEIAKKNEQIGKLSEQVLIYHTKIRSLNSKLRVQQDVIKSIYTTCGSLIQLYMEDEEFKKRIFGESGLQRLTPQSLIDYLYRDIFKSYHELTRAAVTIQSWIRGLRTRRQLKRNGFFDKLAQRMDKDKRHVQEEPSYSLTNLYPISQQSFSTPELRIHQTFETMKMLQQLVFVVGEDTERLAETKNVLKVLKASVLNDFKAQIESELDATRNDFQSLHVDMVEGVRRVTEKPKITRSTMTNVIETKTKISQSNAPVVSTVKVGKKKK